MPKNTPTRIIDSQKTRAASFLGGGAVSLAAHDLGGSLHKGTLRNDQAPQFLLTDGTRSLAGSLAVDAGVTIDGVDLSAHAADINAHHAKVHAITDAANHSVTGSQYQIVGLTAVNTLGLLTPSASPAANAVVKTDGSSGVTLVDLTVTSDLFMSGYLDFGTDVMYEDASYLQVTGSKAVRFGQNIGNANWTVFNAGGASFGGNVDIISGGDLTVIGSGSYAGSKVLFADSSGGNVGIMMNPDSQFALDINGPARATYWIGPHAIQLKGVLLLAHYDGRAPYETNYSGEPNGHMGQVATVAGGLIYRPGKFYKAAQISHAVTNLVTNPRFGHASYLTGWLQWNTPTVVATSEAYIGTTAAWVQTAGSGSIGWQLSGLTNGTIYTATVYAKYGTPTVYLANGSFGGTVNATWTDVGDGWYRAVATRTVTADGYMTFVMPGSSSGIVYSNAQIELRNFPTPYADGALGDGHAWSGTAHASTSTRTATTLAYPASGNINASAGTIMAWVWVDGNDSSTNAEAIVDAGSAWPYCALYMSNGTTPSAIIGGASGNTSASGPAASGVRQWVHVAMTWTGSTLTVYTNGVAGTPVAYTYAPALHTNIRVGYLPTLGNRQLNGYIDDLCIIDRASPAAEIRSIYESNAPVFAETSTFTFRPTPKGLIWADDEGLWMRDTAGNPVLGVYGGEAATKSWAGFTLAAGDLVLGRNAVGSSAIWWDQSAGKFGFYGAGSGTAQVEIATDGTLYSGTSGAQRVQLSSTELAGYNSSNVKQWYGSTTDGKLYAASGKTWLEKNGLSILAPAAADLGVENYVGWATQGNTSVLSGYITCGFTSSSGTPSGTMQIMTNAGGGTSRITFGAAILQLNGMTTSGSAVGTYSGKLKININGVGDVWIPYYAS